MIKISDKLDNIERWVSMLAILGFLSVAESCSVALQRHLLPCDGQHVSHQYVVGGRLAECVLIDKDDNHARFDIVWK